MRDGISLKKITSAIIPGAKVGQIGCEIIDASIHHKKIKQPLLFPCFAHLFVVKLCCHELKMGPFSALKINCRIISHLFSFTLHLGWQIAHGRSFSNFKFIFLVTT